jgi:hypothetical protein
MRIRITQGFCEGLGCALNPGDRLDPPEAKAREWIAQGRAVEVTDHASGRVEQPSSRPRMLEVPTIFKKAKKATR